MKMNSGITSAWFFLPPSYHLHFPFFVPGTTVWNSCSECSSLNNIKIIQHQQSSYYWPWSQPPTQSEHCLNLSSLRHVCDIAPSKPLKKIRIIISCITPFPAPKHEISAPSKSTHMFIMQICTSEMALNKVRHWLVLSLEESSFNLS